MSDEDSALEMANRKQAGSTRPWCSQGEYTAVVQHCGEWWIGWIEEVPGVNCQERSHEKLMQSLAETLSEALELNRRDALLAAGDDYIEEKVVVA